MSNPLALPKNVEELVKLSFSEQNKLMTEGKCMPLVESMVLPSAPGRAVEAVVRALEAANPSFSGIEVSGCDVPNGNRRIYPVQTWAAAIERMRPRIAEGRVYGAVDHPSWSDGAMKDAPIRWTNISLDRMDKVIGDYTITADHSRGKDLVANLAAGWGLAFSTRGYGTAHYPDAEEKVKYGLKDGADDDIVIIDPTYECIAIDTVDNPSWKTAVQPGNPPPASKKDNQDGQPSTTEQNAMKTLAELKAAHPELVAQAETAAVTAIQTKLTDADAAKVKLGESVKVLFGAVAPVLGLALERQLTTDEVTRRIEGLNTQITTHESTITTLKNELAAAKLAVTTAQTERDGFKSQVEGAKRKADVLEARKAALKDHPFAEHLGTLCDKKMDEPTFTVEAQKTFIDAQALELKTFAEKYGVNPNHKPRGVEQPAGTPAADAVKDAQAVKDVKSELSM